ncbi:SDR family oxidoreductase [Alkalicoccobacillus plakortidis]|uniref:SDR family oxidoreductase n=1 Tax=Alkalicoccobacillus plakortidis TaxID=444060 RepID=A0ABT0XPJ5_9BACI|nr:SDR family oxidoreductase [Alkalicoccobacillus plakortidis]MCM2677625.1 SDR family oxidoreductase [Alkalicoccobacillus plakortidis]
MQLENKVAIVTGAASGMGRAIAELYAKEGAKVVAADINQAGVEETVHTIKESGGQATAIRVDLAKREEAESMIDLAVETYGTLDILVNNAGIMDAFEPVGDITDEKWDLLFDINTKSVMYTMRKSIPIFLEKKQGIIVNVASTGGISGAHAGAAYGASKHAVVGLTKNTGYMYANEGIRCNAIAPGGVATNITSSLKQPNSFGLERIKKTTSVMPRVGTAEEIAKVALFLASEQSSFVNGTVLAADAGWTGAF